MGIENMITTDRKIDIVFCIDGTGSMADCIENVKSNARKFYKDFSMAMKDHNSDISSLRIKLITFRDYETEGSEAIEETNFFELPDDDEEFEEALSEISAYGGGDANENGLEALYYAMKSNFTTGKKDRQVITLFTDIDALDWGERKKCSGYPDNLPSENKTILSELWACKGQGSDKLNERLKRLVIFAPAGTKYEELTTTFNRAIFKPVSMGDGLGEIDFSDIIKVLAASASSV